MRTTLFPLLLVLGCSMTTPEPDTAEPARRTASSGGATTTTPTTTPAPPDTRATANATTPAGGNAASSGGTASTTTPDTGTPPATGAATTAATTTTPSATPSTTPTAAAADPRLIARGHQAFTRACGDCHEENDPEGPNPGKNWEEARMRTQIRQGGGRMRPVPVRRLSDADLDALIAFFRSTRAVQ